MSKSCSKETKLITITMAAWGIVLIGSGFVMDKMTKPTKLIKNDVEIISKRKLFNGNLRVDFYQYWANIR